jgi:hypothetical protein
MNTVRIYADFHNADREGRLRLNCVGTIEDLSRYQVELRDGEKLVLYSEELEADGVVEYSEIEKLWVAAIVGVAEPRGNRHQIRELNIIGVSGVTG